MQYIDEHPTFRVSTTGATGASLLAKSPLQTRTHPKAISNVFFGSFSPKVPEFEDEGWSEVGEHFPASALQSAWNPHPAPTRSVGGLFRGVSQGFRYWRYRLTPRTTES